MQWFARRYPNEVVALVLVDSTHPEQLQGDGSVELWPAEAKQAQIPAFTSAQIDFNTPGIGTWVFMTFAPTGPGAVAPSSPFIWGFLGFPDYYMVPNFMGTIPGGFGTYTSPAIPFVCDLVFQGVTITTAGTIEASTPTMVEVF